MEEMKMATIAQEMSRKTSEIGRPKIEPEHIVRIPKNKCGSGVPEEAYAARADDMTVIAYLWKEGKLTIHMI